jgi:predicted ATPase
MLDKIRIKGFRALKDVEIDLPPGKPLVLIGENASGKTTILQAIDLLSRVADGQSGKAIHDAGGWAAVAWAGTSTEIEIAARFSERSPVCQGERAPVEYMIRLGSSRSIPTVLDEEVRVYQHGVDHPPTVVLKGGAASWVINVQRTKKESFPSISESTMLTPSMLARISDEAQYPTPMRAKEALKGIAYYPSFALGDSDHEGREPINARPVERTRRIEPAGRDLLNALHTLSTEYPEAWSELLRDVRAVFPWCAEFRFPAGPGRGLIMLTWRDDRSGATFYLDDMSEGMRVYLALLAALHAPDDPALIAFDEPERSLHPLALRRIVKVMEMRAERTPIVVATHADRLLDDLEDPAASLRITRFSSSAGVGIEALDAGLLDAWRKEYALSELRARGMLEAPPQGDEPPS